MIQFRTSLQTFILEELNENSSEEKVGKRELSRSSRSNDEGPIQIALAFDKGHIQHPIDRKKTVHLKGFFLFTLPLGEFPPIASYDTNKLDKLVKSLAIEHYVLDHNGNAEILNNLSLYPSNQVFLIAPNLKPWNKKTDVFLKGIFCYWSMDNYLSHAVFTSNPLLTKENFSDMTKFLTNILTGMYRNAEGIPNLDIPFLNNSLRSWFIIYQELKEQVAGYEKFHVYFLKELINWIEFYKVCALYLGTNWYPCEQPYLIPRTLGGRKMILEFIQLLTAAYIDDSVRDHVLFKIFCDSAELIYNLVYETFSLPRDTQSKRLCRNVLMRNMKEKEMSFEQALDHQILVVNNEIIDLQKAARALLQEFPTCEALHKYINNTLLFVDGSIRYFSSQKRYGDCEFKIMKVMKYTDRNVIK